MHKIGFLAVKEQIVQQEECLGAFLEAFRISHHDTTQVFEGPSTGSPKRL